MSRRAKLLSREDRLLWSKVARSVEPMAGKIMPDEFPDAGEYEAPEQKARGLPPLIAEAKGRADALRSQSSSSHAIDRPTRKKLAKGRLAIEGKIDLHGMTQMEAHGVLLGFLHDAYARGCRHVLVVTGKGASFGSEGVLRRQVPQWFATPAFRGLVSAHEDAARHHGGEGALYVRLRRRPGEAP